MEAMHGVSDDDFNEEIRKCGEHSSRHIALTTARDIISRFDYEHINSMEDVLIILDAAKQRIEKHQNEGLSSKQVNLP